jgi:hypothetical protein
MEEKVLFVSLFVFLIVGLSSHRVVIGEDAFATIHNSAIKASTLYK